MRAAKLGSRNPSYRYTDEQVTDLARRHRAGTRLKDLAAELGVGRATVAYLLRVRARRLLGDD
jgi:hypothetical protein